MSNDSNKENAATNKPQKKLKKVEGTFADAWKPENEGDTLSGVYLGSQDAVGKRGNFKAYHIRGDDGKRYSISGASLNTIMPQIPKKTHVVITYGGTVAQARGDMKVFDVAIPDGVELIDPFEDDDE